MENLFDDFALPPDEGAEENINITSILLYYSDEEAAEFKKLCKAALKREFPANFKDQNISILLLKMLRDENNSRSANPNHFTN